MAAFTVWKFDNLDGAAHAESVLEDCQAEGFLKVVDHAVVTWPEGDEHPSTSHGNDEKWRGTGWGALWGVLVGALFFVPVVGGVVGAAIGAISKMTEDAGITKEQLETIRTELTPGTSALFVVTEEWRPRPRRRAPPRDPQQARRHQPHGRRAPDPAGDLRRSLSPAGARFSAAAARSARRRAPRPARRGSRRCRPAGADGPWATRVEDAHAVAGLVERDVRVPEHHEVGGREACAHPGRAPLALPAVVDHADPHALQLDLQGLGGTPVGDLGHVVVAHDDVHRRERREQVEDVGGADVAGVEDDVGRLEVREQRRRAGLPPARAVGVGEHEDPHDPARARGPRGPSASTAGPCSRSRGAGSRPRRRRRAAADDRVVVERRPGEQLLDAH